MDSSDNPVAGWMLFLLFIVINSIFYGFGSAIQNLNENEIEDKAEQGDKKSKLLLHIMNAPGSLIQTVQFYHILLSFLVGYVQLKSIMKTVSVSLSATAAGVFFTENPGKIILCILVLFVDLILLATFGILVPKRICSRHAAASAYRMVHMVQAGIILAWPITKLMELLTNLTVRLFGIDPNHTEDDVTEDEIIDSMFEKYRMIFPAGKQMSDKIGEKKSTQILDSKYVRYGISSSGTVLLTSDVQTQNYTTIAQKFESEYLYTYILELYKKLLLKTISQNFNKTGNFKKVEQSFLKFTKNLWIQELTEDEFGNILASRWSEYLKTEEIFFKLKNKYDILYKKYNVEEVSQKNGKFAIAIVVLIVIGVINLLMQMIS